MGQNCAHNHDNRLSINCKEYKTQFDLNLTFRSFKGTHPHMKLTASKQTLTCISAVIFTDDVIRSNFKLALII